MICFIEEPVTNIMAAAEFIERPSGVDLEGASNVVVLAESLDDAAREVRGRRMADSAPIGEGF